MKFKKLENFNMVSSIKEKIVLKIIFIFLFILNFHNFSFAENYNDNALLCTLKPEGSEFGLWFDNNTVSQIGVEKFKTIIDYKEPYKQTSEEKISWLKVTLYINSLELKLGSMEKSFAKCSKVQSFQVLMTKIKDIINIEMNKNTI